MGRRKIYRWYPVVLFFEILNELIITMYKGVNSPSNIEILDETFYSAALIIFCA